MNTNTVRSLVAFLALLPISGAFSTAGAFSAYREDTLPNGLRVVLIEHHANPMVASSVVVGAGVAHEPAGASGASHLLEHLLFNGTTTRTQRELYDEVDRYGAYNNATTREDHTLFTLLIQKEFAEKGLEIQADMLFRSTIPPENFEKEKGIVLEEMARDASDPGYVAREAFRAFAYAGTPIARPVLGTTASIESISRDTVVGYYRERYLPRNMTVVVMGDFETGAMLASIRRIFGGSPDSRKRAIPPKAKASWPAPPETNLRTIPLDAPRTYLHAAFPLGAGPYDPVVPAVELLLEALSDGEDAPLQRELTSGSDPRALSAGVGLARRAGALTTVELSAAIPAGKAFGPVLDALGRALSDLGPGSPARSRLDLVRASARAREVVASDQIHYYALTHSDALHGAPAGWLEGSVRRFDAVTEQDLDRAAALLAKGLATVRIAVAGPGLPEGASRWEAPPPPARDRAGRSRLDRSLPSGMRLLVESSDDSRVFALHLLLRPRSASEPEGKEGIASFLHRLFPRGTKGSDAAALSARLARLGASLKTDDDPRVPYDDYYTTPEFSFVRMELPSEGWREAIALLGEVVLRPGLAADDVEAVRREMLDLQSRRAASSRNRTLDVLARALAPDHPASRSVLGSAESITGVTPHDLEAFHRDYVTGRRMILTVVGPIAPEEVAAAVEGAFAGLRPGESPPEVAPASLAPPPPRSDPPATAEQTSIALSYLFDAPEEERPALTLAGAMLSDDLAFELRERRGLAYSIGASVAPWGGRMRLLVLMGTRRENVEEALAGLREGIASFTPRDDDAVRRAAASLRGRGLMRRLTRVNQAYFLGLEALDGKEPGRSLAELDALLTLDRERVAAAAARHIDPTRCVVVIE